MNERRKQRGVALIICLFALMLLSGIGLGMMYMADTETLINRNYRDSQQAYFAAVAGLQEVRERLGTSSATPITPPSSLPTSGANTGVLYVLNYTSSVPATAIQPWSAGNTYFDTELCHDNFPGLSLTNTGPNTPCGTAVSGTYYTTTNSNSPFLGSDSNLAYRWVRVTMKANSSAVPDTTLTSPAGFYVDTNTSTNTVQICWDGQHQVPKPAGYVTCDDSPPPAPAITYYKSVYVLTSLAITPQGSRRMVQMEIANNPPFISNAAVDTNNFVTVGGSSVTVNGFDNCKCSCAPAPGGGAPTCVLRGTTSPCTGSTYAIYSSQSVTSTGSPALVAGTSPPVAQNQTFPYDINNLISTYSQMPGVVNPTQLSASDPNHLYCAPQTPPAYPQCGPNTSGTGNVTSVSWGTAPNPFPPADPANPIGEVPQITYIPGSVNVKSNQIQGAGILIVDGNLDLNAGINFYGLIIVRGVLTYSGSGTGQNLNILGSVIAGQGSSVDTLQGGINIQYDQCALANNKFPQPPTMLTTHEAMY